MQTTKIIRDHIRRWRLLYRRLSGLERAIVGEQIRRLEEDLVRVESRTAKG